MDDVCRPRLFVYALPDGYRDSGARAGWREPALRGFGPERGVDWLPNVSVHLTDQYELGNVLHQRALAYRCRTMDVGAADLYLVPSFRKTATGVRCAEARQSARGVEPLFERVYAHATAGGWGGQAILRRNGGADHILLHSRAGLPFEAGKQLCELDYRDAQWGAPIILGHEERGNWSYFDDATSQPLPLFTSVPWVSKVHVSARSRRPFPWQHPQRIRRMLVACYVGRRALRGTPMQRGVATLRNVLIDRCRSAPRDCAFATPDVRGARWDSMLAGLRLYWDATFCLMPGGDTVSRTAIVDALLMGCIPVLFHEGQRHQWPWHWARWVRDATIRLSATGVLAGSVDPILALRRVPATRVRDLRLTIARNAHRLQYSTSDTAHLCAAGMVCEDAFDILLKRAWHLSRDAARRDRGRLIQKVYRKRPCDGCEATI
jgi:hypothetical protein